MFQNLNMNKQSLKLACVMAIVLVALACNKPSLTDLNKPVNAINYPIPANIFTAALLNTPQDNYSVLSEGMQYFSTYKEVPAIGDKFYSFNGTEANFVLYYTVKLNLLRQLDDAIQDLSLSNERAMVRILRAYTFHQLTDVAGDIPYFDAMKGESDEILSPKYDPQHDIYLDLLKELDEAATSLDPSKSNFGSADLFYNGDVTKWKKFAYTLMLRLGMRLTKVEPETAETWVKKAIAGGVMMEDGDMAKIQYANASGAMNLKILNTWLNGNYLNPQDPDNVEGGKYAATFIDKLKNTNDPRLPVISVVWQKPGGTAYVPNNDPAVQKGMVSGSLNTKPLDFDTYSEPSPLVLNVASPVIILGPAEAYLLLAEASLRGWYTDMTAEEAYNLGVKAGMTQWAQWAAVTPSDNVIDQEQIDDYLSANPYPSGGTFEEQFKEINDQKWLSLFGDDYEVYANWRRTGYPELAPVNYPGNVTGGKMFRRFSIPITENLVNQDNYLEALQRQNFSESTADNLLTRVWWDKP